MAHRWCFRLHDTHYFTVHLSVVVAFVFCVSVTVGAVLSHIVPLSAAASVPCTVSSFELRLAQVQFHIFHVVVCVVVFVCV